MFLPLSEGGEVPSLFSFPPWVVLASTLLRLLTPPGEILNTSLILTATWGLPTVRLYFDFGLSSQLPTHGATYHWNLKLSMSKSKCHGQSLQLPPSPVLTCYLRNSPQNQAIDLGTVLDSFFFPSPLPLLTITKSCSFYISPDYQIWPLSSPLPLPCSRPLSSFSWTVAMAFF